MTDCVPLASAVTAARHRTATTRQTAERTSRVNCIPLRISLRLCAFAGSFVTNLRIGDCALRAPVSTIREPRNSNTTDIDQHVDASIPESKRQTETRRWSAAARLHFLRYYGRSCSPPRESSAAVKSCCGVVRQNGHYPHNSENSGLQRLSDLSTASELLGHPDIGQAAGRITSPSIRYPSINSCFNSLDRPHSTVRSSTTASQLEPPTSCGGFTVRRDMRNEPNPISGGDLCATSAHLQGNSRRLMQCYLVFQLRLQ